MRQTPAAGAAAGFVFAPSIDQRGFLAQHAFQLSAPPLDEDFVEPVTRASLVAAILEAAAACEHATDVPIPQPDTFAESFADIVGVYLDGRKEALETYWRDNALSPIAADCPCLAPAVWDRAARTLHDVRLSTRTAVVRPRILDGMAVRTAFTLPYSTTEPLPGRYPRIDQPERDGLSVYEVIIGAEPRDSTGNTFRGYLGAFLTWDAHAPEPRWIVSKLAIYNRPNRIGVIMPKL